MRVRSSMRRPASGAASGASGGNERGGASPIFSHVSNACPASARACGWASHSSRLRTAATTRLAAAAAASNSSAFHLARASSTARLGVSSPGGKPSRRKAPSRWCAKLACTRTQPSRQRYRPEILSQRSGVRPSMENHALHSATAARISTAARCTRPLRRRPISVAARAAAAMLACAALPTANEAGQTGSAPARSARASAPGERPAASQRSRRVWVGV